MVQLHGQPLPPRLNEKLIAAKERRSYLILQCLDFGPLYLSHPKYICRLTLSFAYCWQRLIYSAHAVFPACIGSYKCTTMQICGLALQYTFFALVRCCKTTSSNSIIRRLAARVRILLFLSTGYTSTGHHRRTLIIRKILFYNLQHETAAADC